MGNKSKPMEWTAETEQLIDEVYREGLAEIADKQGVSELEVANDLRRRGPKRLAKAGRVTKARNYLIWKLHTHLCQPKKPRTLGVLEVQRTVAGHGSYEGEILLPIEDGEGESHYRLLSSFHIAKKLGLNRSTVTLSIQAQVADRTSCAHCGKSPAEPVSRTERKKAEAQGYTDIWFVVDGVATPHMMDEPFCAQCHDVFTWEKPASETVEVETKD